MLNLRVFFASHILLSNVSTCLVCVLSKNHNRYLNALPARVNESPHHSESLNPLCKCASK